MGKTLYMGIFVWKKHILVMGDQQWYHPHFRSCPGVFLHQPNAISPKLLEHLGGIFFHMGMVVYDGMSVHIWILCVYIYIYMIWYIYIISIIIITTCVQRVFDIIILYIYMSVCWHCMVFMGTYYIGIMIWWILWVCLKIGDGPANWRK